MRFSRLEIKGFKSFANDTVIHFNENVTGIVGPNGSGKSNIVDAIRWVLGEQKSAELRLDKMSSVIFNGTKNKKPAGMAQVSLIFDNTKNILPVDYNEVKITRILYQSGESEYRLNNVTCRLKDIYSLFADTGVGSNTYAIIGFGMVEDLLNNKDNYRRMMIEQAAGISKYKSRKKETLSKLQITIDDLNRVDDLLSEIESNMNTLKKQARRAEKFNEIKNKYKENALILFHYRQQRINAQIQSTAEKMQEGKLAAELKEMEIHNAESDLEIKKNDLIHQEISLTEYQKKANAILDEQKAHEKKRDMTIQRISFVKSKAQQALNDFERAKNKMDELSIQRDTLQSKLPDIEAELSDLNENLSNQQATYETIKQEIRSLESDTEPIIARLESDNSRLFNLEKETAIARAQLTSLQSDAGKFKHQEATIKEQSATLQNQIAESEKSAVHLESQITQLKEEIAAQDIRIQELLEIKEQITSEKREVERKIDQTNHEMKLLKSLIDNQEGFPEAVKYLTSTHKDKEQNLIADLINCEEKYRPTLENFLQAYLTHLVVDTYTEAFHHINLLSSAQKGKAGFIVLEAFSDKVPPPQGIEGATPLSSIIQCHPKYKNLFDRLLYHVYIVENIHKEHLKLMESDSDIRFVTEDGSMTASQGYASGGSMGLIEGNLLGRKIRLESLEESAISLKKADSEYFIKLSDIEEQIKEIRLINKSPQLDTLNKQHQQIKDNLIQLKVKAEHLQLQLEKISADETILLKKLEDFNTKIQQNAGPIEEIKAELQALNEKVTEHREELKIKTASLNEAGNLVNSIKMNVVKSENNRSGIEKEIKMIADQIDSYNEQKKQLESTQSVSLVEMASLEGQLEDTENAIVEQGDRFKAAQAEFSEVEGHYFEEKKKIYEAEQALKILQKALANIQTIANEWKDKWNAANYELNRLEDNFRIEFGELESLDDNQLKHLEEQLIKDLESQNLKLKQSILQFGEINPLALEAYKEIKTRYDEIVTQKNDILESKEKLTQTLYELENTSTTKYLEAFEEVRENFKMVFRSLFTEDDDCDLVITNPGSPLESDIGIIAKPKGKRPQSLSQLSGGEKTLTAIAFLFSLYLLKPAPFCIFDELDAPLDDTNVEKLNKIIRKFSKESQFIIITHNKATMAAVDVMYGVYMEQQGISGLSQVDFRSFEHDLVLERVS
ncbi:MAG: chromosome segregation protein SMC [Saprospiraceae bacterium]|nr:chromosome segregation protein SMC [Saprospiraceae bacterium]